jgi:hypothetical protein
MKKSQIILILMIGLAIFSSSCSSTGTTNNSSPSVTTSVISTNPAHEVLVYATPQILIHFDEIINTYYLRPNSNCSKQDVEEIFNLLKTIQNDPQFLDYPLDDSYRTGRRIFSLYIMTLYKHDNSFIVGMSDHDSKTLGFGTLYSIDRRSDGRFEIINIGNYIE